MWDVVEALESLLPEFEAFGESLSHTMPGVAARTFSLRHARQLHSLGLSCFPVGSDELDERCVALIVNIIKINGLTLKGYVQWQAPSLHHEAETPVCNNPSPDDLAAFCESIRGLLAPLRAAAQRGNPPVSSTRSVALAKARR